MPNKDTAQAKRNLTEGNILSKIVFFALPLMASNFFMNIYSLTEAIIAGNFIGSAAIAALGGSGVMVMLFFTFTAGFNVGSEILISQYYGAKDFEGLRRATKTIFTISRILAVFLALFGFLMSGPVLRLLGTPADIIDDATAYLRVYTLGLVGIVVYMNLCSIFRGMGDSKSPMYFYIGCSVINTLLNILFIIIFGWGVRAIAFATAISHFICAVIAYRKLNSGKYDIKLNIFEFRLVPADAATIMRLALPNSMQQMSLSLAGLVVQYFINPFGSDVISANSLVFRVDSFVIMPLFAFGMAITNFTGQNIGAGKHDRVRRGIRTGAALVLGIGLAVGVLMWFIGPLLLRTFTDDPDVIDIGSRGIRILVFTYIYLGLDYCITGAMRGAGATFVPMVNTIVANIIRIPAAYLLAVVPQDYMGIFYVMPITYAITFIMNIIYFSTGKWKNKAVVKAAPESIEAIDTAASSAMSSAN
jgi:putative MATE family efflux protein